jgi:hypothetical protein
MINFKNVLLTRKYLIKTFDIQIETLNIPEKRTASGGMVDGDLENGRSERADDCKAIL